MLPSLLYVLSCSWLYVSFSSHFLLSLSSLPFLLSVVLIHDVHFVCIHFFVAIVPTFSSSLSSFSYFIFLFFLSLFLLSFSFLLLFYMYCSNLTPPQKKEKHTHTQKPDVLLKNRAGLSEFHKNDILSENKALCCRVQTFWGEILFFKVSETQFNEN